MSGGSYDYFYTKLEEFAGQLRIEGGCPGNCAFPHERKALQDHLFKLVKLLSAIEWNDSGDGDPNERKLMLEFLGTERILESVLYEARKTLGNLHFEIQRAEDTLHRLRGTV
jgi:hypothetical protein